MLAPRSVFLGDPFAVQYTKRDTRDRMKKYARSTRFVGIWGTNWYYFVHKKFPYEVVQNSSKRYLENSEILPHYQGFAIINTPFSHVNQRYDREVHRDFLLYKGVGLRVHK